jgi:arylsulfatase A
MRIHKTIIIILAVCFCFLFTKVEAKKQPNFIIIFIDDMGYGDIEPFGSTINETPNLNRMAEEGMCFTSFYSACSVCSPSRAALMTGSYPLRNGMHKGEWRTVMFPKDSRGLNPNEITIAEVLKEKGYATACFGKWHLGDQPEFLPLNHGFDTYLGIPYSNDMWPQNKKAKTWKNGVTPLPILKDNKVIDIVKDMSEQADLCKYFTYAAVDFIKTNKNMPFFIYLPHAFVHHPRLASKKFLKKASVVVPIDHKRLEHDYNYLLPERTKAQIEEVDWSVGQILNTLRENGLDKNTMVLFTSDNGGARGCSNGPLRGGKGSTCEGGMRVPSIMWWPGTIPAKTKNDEVTSTMDMLPTITNLVNGKLPKERLIDGNNITPMLKGRKQAKSEYKPFFYYKEEKIEAVRFGNWKLREGELYNLKEDIGEKNNVATENTAVVQKLNKYIVEMQEHMDKSKNRRPYGFNTNPQYLKLEK